LLLPLAANGPMNQYTNGGNDGNLLRFDMINGSFRAILRAG